jgi:hypothetical protein
MHAPWGDPAYEYAAVPSGEPDRFPEWERLARTEDGKTMWRRLKQNDPRSLARITESCADG